MPTNEQRQAFRRALHRAREDRGMSQRQLAKDLSVSPSTVSLWEAGETTPRPDVATRVEQALHLDAGELTQLLGYVPVAAAGDGRVSLLEAIDTDPDLSERQRDALARVYRAFITEGGGRPQDRRG